MQLNIFLKISEIKCPRYLPPENGLLECSDTFFYQSKCHFACNEGYSLVGVSTLICETNGAWSDVAPACQSSLTKILSNFYKKPLICLIG